MTVLNVKDNNTSDEIRNLIESIFSGDARSATMPNAVAKSYDTNSPVYESDETRVVLRQQVSIETTVTSRIQDVLLASQGQSFLDHSTRIDLPDVDDKVNTFNYNNYASDAFAYYNLKDQDYENYTTVAEEKSLPSFLIGGLWQRESNIPSKSWDYYSMFGTMPVVYSSLLAEGTEINNYEFDGRNEQYGELPYGIQPSKDYFKVFYKNRMTSSIQYSRTNENIYVDYNYSRSDSEQIGNCPFFNRIRLPRTFASLPPMGLPVPEYGRVAASPLVTAMASSNLTNFLLKSFRSAQTSLRSFELNGDPVELKIYDLLDEIESFTPLTEIEQENEMYLRTSDTTYLSDVDNPFLFYFYKLLSVGKIRSLVRANILDFESIVKKQSHAKEHIGFKVIKKRQGRTTPIQTFYFLGRKELLDFIDTQIRFNTVYTYDVIGMFAIYGSNYSYENFQFTGTGVSFDFVNKPSMKIVEVPMASHTLRVVEPPPLTPEIQFYNEKTSKNKLKIRLEHQNGNLVNEFNQKPMRIFDNNGDYVNRLKQYFTSENILVQSGKTSDGVYEIYRVEEPPTSYADFEGNLIATAQSSVVYSNDQRSKNVMFIDHIKHQKKYYYTFRVLTHQGNPSETSEIYEIEMYEDADETFLLVNMYDFPKPDYYDNEISMRKYLQIIPNFEHTTIDESNFVNSESAVGENIKTTRLGTLPDEDSLWSYGDKAKKYIKLRLESKNSGRKLDLNLLFKINKPTD